jgi:hypothetical protein
MADRTVHYESAFENFLRDRGTAYVAVDEARRALHVDGKLKSFDFVVYSTRGLNLLVDVKGRACRTNSARRSFQTWATRQDVDDLQQWQNVFGEGFRAAFAFVYWIDPPIAPEEGMYLHRERWYWIFLVDLDEYRNAMRIRSAKWQTVALSTADFRQLARPVEQWL